MEENNDKVNYTFSIQTDIIEIEDDNKITKKNNKKKIIVLSMSIFFFLLICFISFDYFILLNPSKNVEGVISSLFNKTNETISNYTSKNTNTIVESGNLILSTNLNEYEELNGYSLSYNIEYDKLKSTSLFDLKLNNNIEEITGKLYYDTDKVYIDFPYLISSMIKFSLNEQNTIKFDEELHKKISNIKNDDITYILDSVKEIILSNIDSNKISKNIDKSNVIIFYDVDNNERIKILNEIANTFVNDSKILKTIYNTFNVTNKGILKYKDKVLNNNKVISLKIYTNLIGKIDKIEINFDNKKVIFNSIIDNQIREVMIEIDYGEKTIESILNLEPYQNGISIDGNIKFNLSNNNYALLELSNISTTNDKINIIDITKARSLKELTEKDLNVINKTINAIKGMNK